MPVSNTSVDNGASSVGIGDFNRDGQFDLAIANLGSQKIDLLIGNGNGDFTNLVSIESVDAPSDLVVTDFTFGSTAPEMMFDVSGEGEITASDALQVINSLVRSSAEGEKVNRVSGQREATDARKKTASPRSMF